MKFLVAYIIIFYMSLISIDDVYAISDNSSDRFFRSVKTSPVMGNIWLDHNNTIGLATKNNSHFVVGLIIETPVRNFSAINYHVSAIYLNSDASRLNVNGLNINMGISADPKLFHIDFYSLHLYTHVGMGLIYANEKFNSRNHDRIQMHSTSVNPGASFHYGIRNYFGRVYLTIYGINMSYISDFTEHGISAHTSGNGILFGLGIAY